MTFFVAGWRYYWGRYLTWVPVQFCIVCGRGYWAGIPWFDWRPGWSDYCSRECCERDCAEENR